MRIGRIGFIAGQLVVVGWVLANDLLAESMLPSLSPEARNTVLGLGVLAMEWTLVTWRCHDFNKNFWHAFWTDALPFVGQFLLLWELLSTPGTPGLNSYGRAPPF